ncbi:MAG: hypothetical protein V5B33_19290 [Candidatus Accumulibacter sp. UW20]
MTYICTDGTDLQELIGKEYWEGQCLLFHDGPLTQAMKAGEELILENSDALSACLRVKLAFVRRGFFVDDTAEMILPHGGFQLILK